MLCRLDELHARACQQVETHIMRVEVISLYIERTHISTSKCRCVTKNIWHELEHSQGGWAQIQRHPIVAPNVGDRTAFLPRRSS